MKKTVAVIGCGALGGTVARAVTGHLGESYTLLGIMGSTPEEAEQLAGETGCRPLASLEELTAATPDYVVEAASVEAVRRYGTAVLEAGSHLIPLSVGALADPELYKALGGAAAKADRKVYIPSGAIGGLDVLRAMRLMGGEMTVRVENRKAPQGLEGAPALGGRRLSREEKELVFSGTADQAIQGFPKNVNVAVAAALSGLGTRSTMVDIYSVPGLAENIHCICGQNDTVRVTLETASLPDPANPRSSTLAAWSVVALLQGLADPIQF